MDCREAQRMIRPFLKNDLNEQDKYAFIMHVKTCKECMDELSLEFIATEGVNLLDNNPNIDLNEELNRIIDLGVHRNHVRRHMRASFVAIVAMIACVLFLVGSAGLM